MIDTINNKKCDAKRAQIFHCTLISKDKVEKRSTVRKNIREFRSSKMSKKGSQIEYKLE